MNTRFVLYSPEAGVYLGNCMGLGFWSKLDAAGQTMACTFPTEQDAAEHVASWDEPPAFVLETKPVQVADASGYATVSEVEAAGMPGWMP